MYRKALLAVILASAAVTAAAGPFGRKDDAEEAARDLYFGEAVYHANQGYYFEALERLDTELGQHRAVDEPALDSLYRHLNEADFSVGDFELNYRMHHRAGRAIKAVLEGAVDPLVRNDAAFRLARIHFEKGQLEDALVALDRIDGPTPSAITNEIEFLRANVYLGLGRPTDAVDVLRRLQNADDLTGFAAYNLGIALLEDGRREDALKQLAAAGEVGASDEAVLAVRDKANFILGTLLVDAGRNADAAGYFDRVRLEGPFSSAALLASGWASAADARFERAVVPWSVLVEREITDAAVQEALLALPHAYGELDVHGRAALLYANALDSFSGELEKLDASIESIREGKFLRVLVREEIRQDKDWVIRLRSLPESPETYYLMDLMASNDFQTALQNYLDLEDLRRKLASWHVSFDAFDDLVGLRRTFYEPRLPEVDAEFRELDSRMRLRTEQHRLLAARLEAMLVAPQPDVLATAEERLAGEELARLSAALAGDESEAAARLRERIARLNGVLAYTLRTEYHVRLDAFAKHVRELEAALAVLTAQHEAFVRARQAAVHSYEGYDTPVARLRQRVEEALGRVNLLMARQGRALEIAAIDELVARRERLTTYQDQARFALADSYDRATKMRADAETAAIREAAMNAAAETAAARAEDAP